MKQFKARVVQNQKIAPDHYVLSFNAHGIAKETSPGQFFKIRVSQNYLPLLRRPFGAHRIIKKKIEILYKVVGPATKILSLKKKGDMLDIIGPLGSGFTVVPGGNGRLRKETTQEILVAGGHGVAPLIFLAEKLVAEDKKPIVLIGAKTKKHVVCEKDFKRLGIKVFTATEDGSKGYKGLATKLLEREAKRQKLTIYACGPKPMLEEIAKIALRYKSECELSLEAYMACGIGTCLGCAVKTTGGYKLVCKDGPVFKAREIVW